MRHNLDLSGGLLMAEQVVMTLAEHVDLVTARNLVDAAVLTAAETGRRFAGIAARRDEGAAGEEVPGDGALARTDLYRSYSKAR